MTFYVCRDCRTASKGALLSINHTVDRVAVCGACGGDRMEVVAS